MNPQANPFVAAEMVDEYLRRQMIPDPHAPRRYLSPDLQIRFTVRAGLIAQTDVWNDCAERLTNRRGSRCADDQAAR